jgi:hypothetical protein
VKAETWEPQFVDGQMVHPRAIAIVEEAYGSGQPFMDSLVFLLLRRGAHTPEQKARFLREGLLRASYANPFLTKREREDIWRRYKIPWLVRLAYRYEAWKTLRRMRTAH